MTVRILIAACLAAVFTTPAFAMDCGAEFRVRVSKMMAENRPQTLTEAVMVDRTRFAIQGYEACMKGDMKSAKELFDRAFDNAAG